MTEVDDRYFVPEEELGNTNAINNRIGAINYLHVCNLLENKVCAVTGEKLGDDAMACGGCQAVYYSSKEAQKQHWKTHKKTCPRHNEIGLGGIRFVPVQLISLSNHPLFASATKVVELDNGMPAALWAVPPGLTFKQVLKQICGEVVVVDASLYAQILVLAMNWDEERNRFSIFTGSSPVSSQLEVFNLPYSTVLTLIPDDQNMLDVLGFRSGATTMDHYQGPRQVELVEVPDKPGFYRGLLRGSGPILCDLTAWGDAATLDMSKWAEKALTSQKPLTIGSRSTWALNQAFAERVREFCSKQACWKVVIVQPEEPEPEPEPAEEEDELDLDAAEHLGWQIEEDWEIVEHSDADPPTYDEVLGQMVECQFEPTLETV